MTPESGAAPTFFLFPTFIGAVAILLYGLQLAGSGLQEIAGARFRALIASVTRNRIVGAGVGALLTAIIQSSGAMTVLLVGLSGAGMIQLSQSIPIILGADIGTTLTVQLIAFQIQKLAPLIVAIGFFIRFAAKRKQIKSFGLAVLGFGFIFLSLEMMTEAMKSVQSYPWIQETLASVEDRPLLTLLAAALLTASFNSSAATLGVAVAMGAQRLITLKTALPIILGANVGTSATAWVASLGAPVEAKRVAMAHVLFKVLGVLLLYPFLDPFEHWIGETGAALPRQIANAHTFFNIGLAAVFLPLAEFSAKGIARLIPVPPAAEDLTRPKYLDRDLLESPPFALEQASREALRMAEIAQSMFRDVVRALVENDPERLEDIERRENALDALNREIKLYITRLSENALTAEQSAKEMAILTLINDLENIGDIIDKNLIELARKKIYTGARFSEAGVKEMIEFHQMIAQDFDLAIAAFAAQNREWAARVIEGKGRVQQRERELRAAHIHRLHLGVSETIETSAIHMDILTYLRRIRSHITSIAHTLVQSDVKP